MLGSNPGRLRGKQPRYPLLHASRAPYDENTIKMSHVFLSSDQFIIPISFHQNSTQHGKAKLIPDKRYAVLA